MEFSRLEFRIKPYKDIMATKHQVEAQNPLILRCNRLIEVFAKSDDERDFYLDRNEGFLIYVDLDKAEEDLQTLENELAKNNQRYCMIPKLTFYETKKIMEGFINEKVYDIDTKEKLLEIIQSKEAREHFLEFIYDHHSELEKWQAFYQERSRIRIIEWLRANHFHFVFEEDLDLPRQTMEKLKKELFQTKVGKDTLSARKILFAKAKTYYSNEALNPRPKRGRPPKQILKTEVEPQISTDIYTTVPTGLLGFLFIPDLSHAASTSFSSKFGSEGDLFSRRPAGEPELSLDTLNLKLKELRTLSTKWTNVDEEKGIAKTGKKKTESFDDDDDDDEDDWLDEKPKLNGKKAKVAKGHTPINKAPPAKSNKASPIKPSQIKPSQKKSAPPPKKPVKAPPKPKPKPKAVAKAKPVKKPAPKAAVSPKKGKALRPLMKLKRKKNT